MHMQYILKYLSYWKAILAEQALITNEIWDHVTLEVLHLPGKMPSLVKREWRLRGGSEGSKWKIKLFSNSPSSEVFPKL